MADPLPPIRGAVGPISRARKTSTATNDEETPVSESPMTIDDAVQAALGRWYHYHAFAESNNTDLNAMRAAIEPLLAAERAKVAEHECTAAAMTALFEAERAKVARVEMLPEQWRKRTRDFGVFAAGVSTALAALATGDCAAELTAALAEPTAGAS